MLVDLSQALEFYGLELSDLFSLARAIDEFKKLGWDIKKILGKYKEGESLQSAIERLEPRIKRYETVLKDLHRRQYEERLRWANYNDAIQIFNKLVQAGLLPDDIFRVSYVLKNNNVFTQETMSQLIEDIEIYGSIAAARTKLERDNLNENRKPSSVMGSFQYDSN
jgi:hypothetical protein